ncbi:MAG: ribonuclease R family protein [Cyanobacteria bacterium J06648_11]
MDFSAKQLFALFRTEATDAPLLDRTQLAQALDLDPESPAEPDALDIALDALVRAGYLKSVESEDSETCSYTLAADKRLVEGQLRCSSKGFCFAIRDEPGEEDIYIHGTNLNGAWNGDRVLARIIKDSRGNRRKSPEGQVAAVIERANPNVVAQLKQSESGLKAVPLDDRLLFELDLTFSRSADAPSASESDGDGKTAIADEATPPLATTAVPSDIAEGQFVYVEIERYPLAQFPPRGYVRKVLGKGDKSSIDIDLVCCKHDLPQVFPDAVAASAARIASKLTKTDLKKRQDYRKWFTVSVRPEGGYAELAFSLRTTTLPEDEVPLNTEPEVLWELGIHITDVTHTVIADRQIDLEARDRAVAVHLDTAVLPLFPERVLEQCNLSANQERPTISVLATLTPQGELRSYEIRPGAICCQTELSYDHVNALLAEAPVPNLADPPAPSAPTEVSELVRCLHIVSHAIRDRRHQQSSGELFVPRQSSSPADDGHAPALQLLPDEPAFNLVAELQMFANSAIARHLSAVGVPAFYRVNPAPTSDAMQPFARLADNVKLDLGLAEAEAITAADLFRCTQRLQQADVMESGTALGLQHAFLGALASATEQLEPAEHAGLGLTVYARATAPLQRYVDLVNQRILHAVFAKGRDRRSSRVKHGVDLFSSSCHGQINWSVLPPKLQKEWLATLELLLPDVLQAQERALQAEVELAGLKKSAFMQKHVGEKVGGLIVGVQKYGFFVTTDPVLAEGLVHVSSLDNDWYEYRNRQQALVGRKNRQQFSLGDRIEVEIKSVDYYRQQIDLAVVGPGRICDDDAESS